MRCWRGNLRRCADPPAPQVGIAAIRITARCGQRITGTLYRVQQFCAGTGDFRRVHFSGRDRHAGFGIDAALTAHQTIAFAVHCPGSAAKTNHYLRLQEFCITQYPPHVMDGEIGVIAKDADTLSAGSAVTPGIQRRRARPAKMRYPDHGNW